MRAIFINDLIQKLTALQRAHGNLPVARFDWQDGAMPTKVLKVTVETVKPHYDGYVLTDCLEKGGFAGREKFTEPYQTKVKKRADLKVVFIV